MAMYNFCDMMSLVLNLVDEKGVLSVTGKYDGFTALHVAATYNAVDVAKLLLDRGVSTKAKGKVCGSLPVHLAAKYRAREVYSYLSSVDPAAIEAKDNLGLTAKEVLESLPADLALPPKSSTGVFSSYWCNHHHTIAPSEVHTSQVPPENVWRLHVLINHLDGVLFSKTLRDRVRYDLKATSASLCDILQVHEWSYIRRIQAACEELVDDAEDPKAMTHLDGDTAISKESYRAALGAAGAVCQAIDEVLQGQVRNAFCPIRPPGHHVGSRGAVKSNTGSDSHGFCLINNVSIGAAHAMNRYRDTVRRVVIVDFDVHHGNGTESTVRNLRPNVERVSVNELGVFGSICVPSYKPWRDENDADNVLFVSVHGYGPPQRGMENLFPRAAFYPGTGATSLPKVKARQQMAGEDANKDPISSPPVEYTVAQSNKKSEDGEAPDEEASSESSGGMRLDDDDDDDDDSDFVGDEDGDGIDNASNGEQFSSIGAGGIFDSKLEDTFYMYDLSAHNSRAVSRAPSPMILDIGVPLPDNIPFDEDTVHSRLLADFQYRHQWRNYFRDHIFPRIATFQPDLVLISAGFDAHRKDTINAGYIALGEEDFVWVTEHLLLLAEEHCAGRVVSVLEGGYQIGGEFSSAFARSVAAHVETLARAPLSPLYSSKVMALEKACEEKVCFSRLLSRSIDPITTVSYPVYGGVEICTRGRAGSSANGTATVLRASKGTVRAKSPCRIAAKCGCFRSRRESRRC